MNVQQLIFLELSIAYFTIGAWLANRFFSDLAILLDNTKLLDRLLGYLIWMVVCLFWLPTILVRSLAGYFADLITDVKQLIGRRPDKV